MAALILLLLLAGACGGGKPVATPTHPASPPSPAPSTPSPTPPASPSPSRSPIPSPAAPAPAQFADWPVYHADVAHSGVAPASPAGSGAAPAPAWTAPLDGAAYAEPIVAGGKVIAATENNTVYAFNPATGQQVWANHLEAPQRSGALPCGNIGPTTGITGTPVADVAAGLVYAVALSRSGTHALYALRLADGSVAWSAPADPPGLSPLTEQQRAGLVLANGLVYVAYGGLYGDCGTYRGAVVGIPASGSGATISYVVPSQNRAGIWAPPGPAVDASGNLFVATGNSTSSGAFDSGNAVIRLTPALQVSSQFAPSNWASRNAADLDLGSQSPALLQGGYLFQAGKDGTGFILAAGNLGGIGGQVSSGPVCAAAFGGTAYAAPVVYSSCTSGIVAVSVSASGMMRVAWRSPSFDAGPPILADGSVWALDLGAPSLDQINPATGAVVHTVGTAALPHFATPSASGGLIFVAGLSALQAFRA